MNDVNLAPENKEATPEHGYLMAYDKKEQKAKGVKGIAANGELETLEANEANRDQFIKVDQRGNFFTNFGKNFLYQYNNQSQYPARKNTIQNDRSRDRKYFTTDSKDLSLFLKLDRRCRNTVGKSGDRHERTGTSPVCK